MTITRARLDGDEPDWRQCSDGNATAEIMDWLEAHGLDPTRVKWVELDVIDAPLVRASVMVEETGRVLVGPDGCHLHETVEVLQRADPPTWWQPRA